MGKGWILGAILMLAWVVVSMYYIMTGAPLSLPPEVQAYLPHFVVVLGAGLLFWFPVVRPYPARPPWSRWLLVPYLLLADVQNTVLSALLTFSDRVLYPYYAERAPLWGITALFLAGFLWLLLRSPAVSKTARGFQVHLFERGWVWVRRKGTEVYRFDEVQTLFAAIVVVNNSGVTTTVYDYRITCNDGRQTRMRQIHTDMARFGPALAAQVAQAQLPKALSYFDKGNPVAFGDLTVTEDGLATKKGKVVPWPQVGGIQVAQGFVSVVDRAGKRVSPQVSFGQMPNAHTFLLMTETILAKLRGAEA